MIYSLISMASSMSSDAGAAGGTAQAGGGGLLTFAPILIMVVIFYFLLIRPQRKRDKETKNMLAAIKKGDKVVTIGGIRGVISAVKESSVVLKVDDNTKIEFNKSAISQVLNQSATAVEVEKKSKKEKEEIVEAPTLSDKEIVDDSVKSETDEEDSLEKE